jgi:hypothetical protein
VAAYALTIFVGAFLLFQVQPLIGKYILPWFGGAPSVWTICMLFFQTLLLAGYAYAHFTSRWLKARAQVVVHMILLVGALALLPITPSDSWKPHGPENPVLRILGLLVVSLGVPYLVLSSTGPLMQYWFSRAKPGVSPFRLYALSNVGSLLALISFPVFFETHFTRVAQARLWQWGFYVYVVASAFCALKFWRAPALKETVADQSAGGTDVARPSVADKILWLLLPACAAVLLLATTNKMCQEVAVVPFLWVLPLSLYLLSFVICFDSPRWYRRVPFTVALLAAWAGIAWMSSQGAQSSMVRQLTVYSAGLFICCMICHGELYRLKPDPRHLTFFYLMIAAGGAIGGVLVALIAPLVFTDYFEFQWGLLLCGGLFLIVCVRDRKPGGLNRWRLPVLSGLSVTLVLFGVELLQPEQHRGGVLVHRSRNFYGVLKVTSYANDQPGLRYLEMEHGRTLHGLQFVEPARAVSPTLYYSQLSGVGRVLDVLPGARRIGVVGLGVGTLAAYGRAGDYIHYYEINPEVERLATSRFKYLTNCPGNVKVTLGDARISLEREPAQEFDLLALDAFNSDSIPMHLLTREAFSVYQRHLKTNGVIAVHVSNFHLNLEPVVINLAHEFGYRVAAIDHFARPENFWDLRSIWMVLSRDDAVFNEPTVRYAARPPRTNASSATLWTDDFTSLFQVLNTAPAVGFDPEFSANQIKIANDLCLRGDFVGAVAQYRHSLESHPRLPELLNNLAWLLATCPDPSVRNGREAVEYSEKACRITTYGMTVMVGTLGAAYAEAGRFPEACDAAQKACMMASEVGDDTLLKRNTELLELYRTGRPFHESFTHMH